MPVLEEQPGRGSRTFSSHAKPHGLPSGSPISDGERHLVDVRHTGRKARRRFSERPLDTGLFGRYSWCASMALPRTLSSFLDQRRGERRLGELVRVGDGGVAVLTRPLPLLALTCATSLSPRTLTEQDLRIRRPSVHARHRSTPPRAPSPAGSPLRRASSSNPATASRSETAK